MDPEAVTYVAWEPWLSMLADVRLEPYLRESCEMNWLGKEGRGGGGEGGGWRCVHALATGILYKMLHSFTQGR